MSTSESKSLLGLTLRILRDEGLQAVWNRSKDRAEEKKRLGRLAHLTVRDGELSLDFERAAVLNVSPTPPSPKRGGSQIQMLDRLAVEKKHRTVALAYPKDESWWLEIWTAGGGGILAIGETSEVAELISQAADLAGAEVVHVENISGLPLNLISELASRGRHTVLSVHDFTLFCRKPHLIERATGAFCGYCVDEERCTACLRDIDLPEHKSQTDYRTAGAEALANAATVIFPSEFLRQMHRDLFPALEKREVQNVIPPASARPHVRVDRATTAPRVGFIGGAYAHKGAALIPSIMDLVREQRPEVRGFVYGNGERESLQALKAVENLTVRGYYRQGDLARMLARDEISVAVLTSIWPEAYGLVVDECLAAGVPVIAFDHGAVADRLGSWKIGHLTAPELGAHGLAEAIVDALSNRAEVPESVIENLPRPESVAHEHVALYRILLSWEGASREP
jgi:glycosyltransferase involved in cell wall biosynthesis